MLQQQVTAFSGPDFDESRSLQLTDHLGPGHCEIVNLALGYVNAAPGLGHVPSGWQGTGYAYRDTTTTCDFDSGKRHVDDGAGYPACGIGIRLGDVVANALEVVGSVRCQAMCLVSVR